MYVKASDLSNFPELKRVESLDSVEDVATLLDTFVNVRKKYDYKSLNGVMMDKEGHYYFIVDGSDDFNLYSFVNNSFGEDIEVSCVNALYLFPRRLSRGISKGLEYIPQVQQNYNEDDEDDIPTGYLDSNPIGEDTVYSILRKSDGTRVSIPAGGIIVGRSASKANYVIKGNTNVGRVHCEIYAENGVLKVHDFNSLNGTFVNSRRVQGVDVVLNVGDKLTLADEEFEIVM